jgi:hypothetical protein
VLTSADDSQAVAGNDLPEGRPENRSSARSQPGDGGKRQAPKSDVTFWEAPDLAPSSEEAGRWPEAACSGRTEWQRVDPGPTWTSLDPCDPGCCTADSFLIG